MGIRPEDVTAEMYKRFDEATQKRYEEIGALKALPDPESRAIHKFERDHQRRVVALCKKNGLVCGWSGTHKRSTYTEGWPDLTIPYKGGVLFIELKADGGKLSAAQWDLHKDFFGCGVEIKICFSDAEAWESICKWLWNNFGWKPRNAYETQEDSPANPNAEERR